MLAIAIESTPRQEECLSPYCVGSLGKLKGIAFDPRAPTLENDQMSRSSSDSTRRFSNRVENYVRFRPGYPAGVIDTLREEARLTPAAVVADIGSGTGISSDLFLRNGNTVIGIEPNAEMRQAAEERFRNEPRFRSVAATAEATTLEAASVEFVVAGQAFHWFDLESTRREFARILRHDGWVVLIWNVRRTDSSKFLIAYEALLNRYGTDYSAVRHENIDQSVLRKFFAGDFTFRSLPNEQRFDLEGVKGRLLSSSYAPTEEHPSFRPMIDELERAFRDHAVGNQVCFEYDTELYFGHVG
jgi:SAM-dependent methyltransferase